MITEKDCDGELWKAKAGFPMSLRAHTRTAKAESSVLCGKLVYHRHLDSDHLEVSSFLPEMLHNSWHWFYHIGQRCGLVCFEPLRLRGDWSLFWHPQQWNVCVYSKITQRKRRVYWHPYPHSRACLSSAHLHYCAARKRIVSVPPLVEFKGLCLHPLCVLWVWYGRQLHSHSEGSDRAKEWFSGVVLRLGSWVLFVSLQYSSTHIHVYVFILCALSMLVESKWQKTNALGHYQWLTSRQQYVDLYQWRKAPKILTFFQFLGGAGRDV